MFGNELDHHQPSYADRHIAGIYLRPVDVCCAAHRRVAPVDHQFVRIVQQGTRCFDQSRTRPYVEGLRDAVRSRAAGVVRSRELEVTLRELVRVLRSQRHESGVRIGAPSLAILLREAMVRSVQQRLNSLAIDHVGRIVDVEETAASHL